MSERNSQVRAVFPTEAEEIEAIESRGLADPEMKWLDVDGAELFLGCFVRMSPLITGMPTAYPKMYTTDRQRLIDYGRVVELLAGGKVRVEWTRCAGEVGVETAALREDSTDLELSTSSAFDAFEQGMNQGYEEGFRSGHMVFMNGQREALGMPALTNEEFDDRMVLGALQWKGNIAEDQNAQ